HHAPVADVGRQVDEFVLLAKVQLLEDVGEAHVLEALVDDETHRAFVLAVPDEIDHRVAEAIVSHAGRRDQKLTFERHHLLSPLVPRSETERGALRPPLYLVPSALAAKLPITKR